MIILFGGKEYAVGLTWFSISTPAEIDQFKREMDMTLGVMKLAKDDDQPSCVALAPNEYVNQTSLAAAISYAHENLIYVYKTDYKDDIGRELYYLCCVKHGAVTVEGDTIADLDTIQALYAQSLLDLRTDIADDHIELLGTDVNDDRFEGVQLIDVGHMSVSIQRYEGQCAIKEIKNEGPSKKKMIILVALALATLVMGYQLFKPAPPPPPVTAPPVVKASPPVAPFDQFLNSLQLQNTVTLDALPHIVAGLMHIPIQISGWQVTDITVNLGSTVTYTLKLKRTAFATVGKLRDLEKSGVIKNISIDTQGEEARVSWGSDVKEIRLLSKADLQFLKDEKNASTQTQFLTRMQSSMIKANLETAVLVAGYPSQQFSYKSKGLWAIDGFSEILQGMKAVGITRLHVVPANGQYEWELQGVIYG